MDNKLRGGGNLSAGKTRDELTHGGREKNWFKLWFLVKTGVGKIGSKEFWGEGEAVLMPRTIRLASDYKWALVM